MMQNGRNEEDYYPQEQEMPLHSDGYNQPYDYYNPIQSRAGLSAWQFDPKDLLETLESFLRGRIKKDDGSFEVTRKPQMLDDGVDVLMSLLQSHLNDIIFASNLNIEMIRRMSLNLRRAVIDWVYLNFDVYEINKGNATFIVESVDNIVHCALMKPMNDKERQHRYGTIRRTENVMVRDDNVQRKTGNFNFL